MLASASSAISALATRGTSCHAVIILASGLSQRLGQPKQLLRKKGKPLIIDMIQQAVATQPQVIIIITPKEYPAIAQQIKNSELTLLTTASIVNIVNPVPSRGMAHSLFLGINALNARADISISRVLIMGIDQVLLTSAHLIEVLAAKRSELKVVASRYPQLDANATENSKSFIVGMPIAISLDSLLQWQANLEGDKGLRHLVRALPSDQIAHIDNPLLSYDIDTPEQLAYAQEQNWLDN